VRSVVSNNGSWDKEIRTRLGKANSVFERLKNIWKSRKLATGIKRRLYNALFISTLL